MAADTFNFDSDSMTLPNLEDVFEAAAESAVSVPEGTYLATVKEAVVHHGAEAKLIPIDGNGGTREGTSFSIKWTYIINLSTQGSDEWVKPDRTYEITNYAWLGYTDDDGNMFYRWNTRSGKTLPGSGFVSAFRAVGQDGTSGALNFADAVGRIVKLKIRVVDNEYNGVKSKRSEIAYTNPYFFNGSVAPLVEDVLGEDF